MKHLFLLLLFSSICTAQVKTVESKVIEATVFKDRAMVTRSSNVELHKGVNEIVFSDLTTDIKDESVHISAEGNGQVKILDVKVERRFTAEIRKEKINELQKEINSLKNELKIATDKISVYNSKLEFIASLKAEAVKYSNQKILLSTSSPKEWTDLLNFIDVNLTEIYAGIREQVNKKAVIEQEIKSLQMTMNQSKSGEERNYKEIIVKIESSVNGKFKINPSYIVNSANWYPIYDARVSSENKEIELSYFAMMQQSTGEDWNDVKLTFSTADPLSVKSLPRLEPWFLDINPLPYKPDKIRGGRIDEIQFNVGGYSTSYDQNWGLPKGLGAITGYITDKETGEPLIGAIVKLENTSYASSSDINGKFYMANVRASSYNLKASYIGYNKISVRLNVIEKHVANLNIPLAISDITVGGIVVEGTRFYGQYSTNTSKVITTDKNLPKFSNVKAKNLSTTFELKTKNSIPSDNSPHKVTIAISNLPIEFEYTTTPKILPKVYLKGKTINNNDYPLLEGEINIFVDNDFVNRTYINNIVASDSFELALGIDESIQSEKILINRFVESKGLFGGTKQITYDYEIKVTNNRKTEEKIWVYDQLPVAMNEGIKIELITPSEKEEGLNKNKEIVWQLTLSPGEKKILPLKFTVEFPSDISVYGLE